MIELKEEIGGVFNSDHLCKTMNSQNISTLETNNNSVIADSCKNKADSEADADDIDQENLIINIKKESNENGLCDGEDREEEEPESTQMSPVETATLLLLSRIALFNKVRPLFKIS